MSYHADLMQHKGQLESKRHAETKKGVSFQSMVKEIREVCLYNGLVEEMLTRVLELNHELVTLIERADKGNLDAVEQTGDLLNDLKLRIKIITSFVGKLADINERHGPVAAREFRIEQLGSSAGFDKDKYLVLPGYGVEHRKGGSAVTIEEMKKVFSKFMTTEDFRKESLDDELDD